jgi:HNH endonuclease
VIRRISAWPKVTYDFQHGFVETKGSLAGCQFISFEVAAEANGHRGYGFDSVQAANESDQSLLANFNNYLDGVLPRDNRVEDYKDFRDYMKNIRHWKCSDLEEWPRIAASPEFRDLASRVIHSESLQLNFWTEGCFLGKEYLSPSHDYILYKNAFWALDKDLDMDDCKAIMESILRREEQKVEFLKNGATPSTNHRDRIPENVRTEVWRRDGGQCVRCGSRMNLEFDHIVPVSMGGSNTARNIELLCETCNRAKGASV